MQDLPENHFRMSGASWVNITNYLLLFTGCLGEHEKKLVDHGPEATDLQAFQKDTLWPLVSLFLVRSDSEVNGKVRGHFMTHITI